MADGRRRATPREQRRWAPELRRPGMSRLAKLRDDGSQPAEDRNVVAAVVGGVLPAVLVVVGHAALGQRLHLLEPARSLCLVPRKEANQLMAAGVIHLVELVPRPELAADRVPQELHDLDALLVVDAVGAADVAGKV